jgi:hypothetical protein
MPGLVKLESSWWCLARVLLMPMMHCGGRHVSAIMRQDVHVSATSRLKKRYMGLLAHEGVSGLPRNCDCLGHKS